VKKLSFRVIVAKVPSIKSPSEQDPRRLTKRGGCIYLSFSRKLVLYSGKGLLLRILFLELQHIDYSQLYKSVSSAYSSKVAGENIEL